MHRHAPGRKNRLRLVPTSLASIDFSEALAYLLLPFEVLARLIRWFNTPAYCVVGGVVSFVFGVFLAGKGFQVF